jgi:hypothetical protein
MIIETLLDNLHEYIGKEQASMLKEIVAVNELKEQEVRQLIKEYIKD